MQLKLGNYEGNVTPRRNLIKFCQTQAADEKYRQILLLARSSSMLKNKSISQVMT